MKSFLKNSIVFATQDIILIEWNMNYDGSAYNTIFMFYVNEFNVIITENFRTILSVWFMFKLQETYVTSYQKSVFKATLKINLSRKFVIKDL